MDSDLLPLSRFAVDRDANRRAEPDLLVRLWADPATRVVLVHRGLVAVEGGTAGRDDDAHLAFAAPTDVAGLEVVTEFPVGAVELIYLGRDDDAAYVAYVLGEGAGASNDFTGDERDAEAALVAGRSWASMRDVGAALSDRDAGLAVTAVAVAAWHARHVRCPLCGEPTEIVESGWVRRCTSDGSQHYPRTDPAIIVAVTDAEDRLLLGHAARWPEGRYSTLAGYVEPGESLEAATRREVEEESGLVIGDIAYQGSQPWPFPGSLMLGFRARVLGGELRVDGEEITHAQFFTRSGLAADVAAGRVLLPMRASIARALIEDWFGAQVPGS